MIYTSAAIATAFAVTSTLSQLTSAAPAPPPLMSRPTPPSYPSTSTSDGDGSTGGGTSDTPTPNVGVEAVRMGTRLYAADGKARDLFGYAVAASTISNDSDDAPSTSTSTTSGAPLTSVLAVGAPQASQGAGAVHVSCTNAQLGEWVDDQIYGPPGSAHFGAAIHMPPKHAHSLFVASKQFKGPIGPKLDSIALSAYAITTSTSTSTSSDGCDFEHVDTVRLHTTHDTLLSVHSSDTGSLVILGAPYFNSRAKPGAAFVYSRNNTAGDLEFVSALAAEPTTVGDAELTTAPDSFGYSVAINDIFAAVGAPETNALTGAVHVYKCDTTDRMWSNPLVLYPPFDLFNDGATTTSASTKLTPASTTTTSRRDQDVSDVIDITPSAGGDAYFPSTTANSNSGVAADDAASTGEQAAVEDGTTITTISQDTELASNGGDDGGGGDIPVYSDPETTVPSSNDVATDIDTSASASTAADDDVSSGGQVQYMEPVYFGQSLALSHNLLYIGAPGWDKASGRVFVYSLGLASNGDSVVATLHASLVASDAARNAMFGFSLSAVLGGLAVGAPGVNMASGAVYVYELGGAVTRASASASTSAAITSGAGSDVVGDTTTTAATTTGGVLSHSTTTTSALAVSIATEIEIRSHLLHGNTGTTASASSTSTTTTAVTTATSGSIMAVASASKTSTRSAGGASYGNSILAYTLLNKYYGGYANNASSPITNAEAGAGFGTSVAITPILLLGGADKASGPLGVASGAAFATTIDLSTGYDAQPHTKYSVSSMFIIAAEVVIPSLALIFVATRAFKAAVRSRSSTSADDSTSGLNSSSHSSGSGRGRKGAGNSSSNSNHSEGYYNDPEAGLQSPKGAVRNQFYSKYDDANSTSNATMAIADVPSKSDIGSVANNWGILAWINSRNGSNGSTSSLQSVSLDISTRSTDALAPQSERGVSTTSSSMTTSATIAPAPTAGGMKRGNSTSALTITSGLVDCDSLQEEATPARSFLSILSPAVTFANSRRSKTSAGTTSGTTSGSNTPCNGTSTNTTSIAASHITTTSTTSQRDSSDMYISPPNSPMGAKHNPMDHHIVAV